MAEAKTPSVWESRNGHLTDVCDHELPGRKERLTRMGERRRGGQVVLTADRDEPSLAFNPLDPNAVIHSERLPGCPDPENPRPRRAVGHDDGASRSVAEIGLLALHNNGAVSSRNVEPERPIKAPRTEPLATVVPG
jgi:hypothetical protein